MSNTLIIAVTTGKGGREFAREADAFAVHWRSQGENVRTVKMKAGAQWLLRLQVQRAIWDDTRKIDRLVFFCHGTPKWLRVGFHIWNVDDLAAAIAEKSNKRIRVALYACSCGRGRFEWPWTLTDRSWVWGNIPGKAGFAARLTGALAVQGVRAKVFAHSSRGHTTRNPYCYRFEVVGGVVMRTPVVVRGAPDWEAWKKTIKTLARFEVPFRG